MQNETRRRREDKSNGKRLILRTVPLASEETESSYVPRHHLKKKHTHRSYPVSPDLLQLPSHLESYNRWSINNFVQQEFKRTCCQHPFHSRNIGEFHLDSLGYRLQEVGLSISICHGATRPFPKYRIVRHQRLES